MLSGLLGSSFTAETGQADFLQLLTTQLRFQDPLEPVKQENFTQQLAQFATLEGIEKLNARFDDLLRLQQLTEGANLVGRLVIYQDEKGTTQSVGRAESVLVKDQQLNVQIDGKAVPLERIVGLAAES
jgi:flagellar basal-body rod modification protein FlgD